LGCPRFAVGKYPWYANVVDAVEFVDEVVALKDDAYVKVSEAVECAFGKGINILSVYVHTACCRRVQAGEYTQQRTFSAAAGAYDGHYLPLSHIQADTAEDVYLVRPVAYAFYNVCCGKHVISPFSADLVADAFIRLTVDIVIITGDYQDFIRKEMVFIEKQGK
jgi:hypothetical protein